MNPATIWQAQQNKPSLLVHDLAAYAPADAVYESLLRRGVFKWFAVRRALIKLKAAWKARVTDSICRQRACDGPDVNYWRGYRRALEECRAEVRALCHSPRWTCQNNDQRAKAWLSERRKG